MLTETMCTAHVYSIHTREQQERKEWTSESEEWSERRKKSLPHINFNDYTHLTPLVHTHLSPPFQNHPNSNSNMLLLFLQFHRKTTLHINSINTCPVRRHWRRHTMVVWCFWQCEQLMCSPILSSSLMLSIVVAVVGAINANKVIAERFYFIFFVYVIRSLH